MKQLSWDITQLTWTIESIDCIYPFESHWVPLSYGLVPHLSKKLSKFPLTASIQRGKPPPPMSVQDITLNGI